jgi:hypothetical protein
LLRLVVSDLSLNEISDLVIGLDVGSRKSSLITRVFCDDLKDRSRSVVILDFSESKSGFNLDGVVFALESFQEEVVGGCTSLSSAGSKQASCNHDSIEDVDLSVCHEVRECLGHFVSIFECAAYELSQLLGFYNVPPAVLRKIKRDEGTLQIWIEHAMTEKNRRKDRIAPVDRIRFNKEWQMIDLFDNLVFNDDRNSGNVIIDNAWGIWMIDHTRAFRLFDDLKDVSRLTQCERTVWSKLQTVEDAAVTDVLKPYLRPYEIESLLKRRQKLIIHIQTLIDEKGEDAVLFTWWTGGVKATG